MSKRRPNLAHATALLFLLVLVVWYFSGGTEPGLEQRFDRAEDLLKSILKERRAGVEQAARSLSKLAGPESPGTLAQFRRAESIREAARVDGLALVDWENEPQCWAGRSFEVDPMVAFFEPRRGTGSVGIIEQPGQRVLYAAEPAGSGVALAFLVIDQSFPRRDDLGEKIAAECGLSHVKLSYGSDPLGPAEKGDYPSRTAVYDQLIHARFFAYPAAHSADEAAQARAVRLDTLLFAVAVYACFLLVGALRPALRRGGILEALLVAACIAGLRWVLALLALPDLAGFGGLWGAPGASLLSALAGLACMIVLMRANSTRLPRVAAALLAAAGLAASLAAPRVYVELVNRIAAREDGVVLFDPLRVLPDLPAATLLISVALLTGALFLLARVTQRWLAHFHRSLLPLPLLAMAVGLLPFVGPWLAGGSLLAILGLVAGGSRPERAATVAFLAAVTAFPPLYFSHRDAYVAARASAARDLVSEEEAATAVDERLDEAVARVRSYPTGRDREVATRIAEGVATKDIALDLWAASRWDIRDPCSVQVWDRSGKLLSSFDFDGPPEWWLPAPPEAPEDSKLIQSGVGRGEAIEFRTHGIALRTALDRRVVGMARFSVPSRWDMLVTNARPSMFTEPQDLLVRGAPRPVFVAELSLDGMPRVASEGRTSDFEIPSGTLLGKLQDLPYTSAPTRWRGKRAHLVLVKLAKYRIAAVVFAENLFEQPGFAFAKLLLTNAALSIAYMLGLLLWRRGRVRLLFRHRLVLFVTTLTVLPVALLGLYNKAMAEERYEREIRESLENRLDLATNLLVDRPEMPDTDWCQGFAESHRMDINVYRDAELIATSRPGVWDTGLFSRRLSAPAYLAIQLGGRSDYTGAEIFTRDAGLHAAYRRLEGNWSDEKLVLSAPALEDRRELERREAQGTALLLASYLVAAILTIFVGLLLARTLTRPVRELRDATARVATGRLQPALPEGRGDEFGELMRAFNRMTRELAEGQELRVRAEKAAAWREMARQIAHDIKNPLTPIKLTVQNLLAAYEEDPENFEEYFKEGGKLILDQIDSLHRIAGQFSTYARLPVRNPQPVSVGGLVDEIVKLYSAAGEIAIERRGELDDARLTVLGDRDELRRAIGNLVANSRQAKATRITITGEATDDQVNLVLNDNGSGMEAEILAQIFEPSFTTKTSGTGLGMPIAKRIVDDHLGTIAIRSTPGLGTRVTLLFPRHGA